VPRRVHGAQPGSVLSPGPDPFRIARHGHLEGLRDLLRIPSPARTGHVRRRLAGGQGEIDGLTCDPLPYPGKEWILRQGEMGKAPLRGDGDYLLHQVP
jgi:hypothetical protein